MSRALYTASYISIADLSLGFFNLSRLIYMQDKLKAKNKTPNVIRTHIPPSDREVITIIL